MARTEARVYTSIWKDGDFLALSPGAQRLYLYLLSQPELTYCGTMPLRERRWVSGAAGLTLTDIERDLKELEGTAYPSANPSANPASRQPFILTDPDAGELLVRSLLRGDGAWKQPNLLKQAMGSADEIESPRIRSALLAEIRRLPLDEAASSQVKTLIKTFIEILSQGTAYPAPYPADDPKPDPSGETSDDPTGNARPRARLPLSPIPSAPTTLPAPLARDRKTGTRLPEPFTVTADMKTWFRGNCPHVDAAAEHEKFLDYWRGKAGTHGRKVDWTATWRNWMRTAEDRAMPRQRAATSRRLEATDEIFERAAKRFAGREAAS